MPYDNLTPNSKALIQLKKVARKPGSSAYFSVAIHQGSDGVRVVLGTSVRPSEAWKQIKTPNVTSRGLPSRAARASGGIVNDGGRLVVYGFKFKNTTSGALKTSLQGTSTALGVPLLATVKVKESNDETFTRLAAALKASTKKKQTRDAGQQPPEIVQRSRDDAALGDPMAQLSRMDSLMSDIVDPDDGDDLSVSDTEREPDELRQDDWDDDALDFDPLAGIDDYDQDQDDEIDQVDDRFTTDLAVDVAALEHFERQISLSEGEWDDDDSDFQYSDDDDYEFKDQSAQAWSGQADPHALAVFVFNRIGEYARDVLPAARHLILDHRERLSADAWAAIIAGIRQESRGTGLQATAAGVMLSAAESAAVPAGGDEPDAGDFVSSIIAAALERIDAQRSAQMERIVKDVRGLRERLGDDALTRRLWTEQRAGLSAGLLAEGARGQFSLQLLDDAVGAALS